MNKKLVCMCYAVTIKQKTQRLFDEFFEYLVMSYII